MASNRYCIDIAKRGTAGCKECKTKIEKDLCRIGIVVPNPFAEGDMKQWFHAACVFQKLSRSKAATKKIEDEDDLEGWDEIDDEIKEEVRKHIKDFWDVNKAAVPKGKKKEKVNPASTSQKLDSVQKGQASPGASSPGSKRKEPTIDDAFKTFRKVCANIYDVPEYTEKTAIVADFFKNGLDKKGFKGDLYLWVKMLLPGVDKRVFNLQNKQLVKLFSQIFDADHEEMIEDLNEGDVSETIGSFFESSEKCPPAKKSLLTLQEVDSFLEDLTHLSKEEEQMKLLHTVAKKCTANDMRMFIKLIKHDLRIHVGPKHILNALHPTAYQAFQASHNLKEVVRKATQRDSSGSPSKSLSVKASVLTPIKPMLAQVCGSVEKVFEKCPNGPLVEIKYDGERVQVHKSGDEFSYFSRSLKPVMPGKVIHLKDFIPKAFPHGNDLILDSEILLVDSKGTPLPFGTLGEHKKKAFKDATVCLFIFDCIQFNDQSLINKPLDYRRKVLQENIREVKNHVVLSEMKAVDDPRELSKMIESVMKQGLEGLVIKDRKSLYEPGKRHWLKLKKDYFAKGAIAGALPDSADLVVLGAYYGTGRKGGIMSVFLMGCYNERTKKWCTVTKVGGRKDNELKALKKSLKVDEINKDPLKVPKWLNVTKSLVPDFVVEDPWKSQVWEITGAEFTNSDVHTADGISIRFPRVSRVRDDKSPKEATTLSLLMESFEVSKQTSEKVGLRSPSPGPSKRKSDEEEEEDCSSAVPAKKKRSLSPSSESDSPKRRSKSPISKKSKSITVSSNKRTSSMKSPSKSPTRKPDDIDGNVNKRNSNLKRQSSVQSDYGLPNVFTGVKLYISKSVEQYDTLRKYFIAFDGIILKEHEKMDANFFVSSLEDDECPPKAKRISSEWLWDSIKLKRLLPSDIYCVENA